MFKKKVETFLSQLKSKDWKIRYDAVLALCQGESGNATHHLIDIFKDKNEHVRGCVAEHICLTASGRDYKIISLLEQTLNDKNYYVRLVSIESLVSLGSLTSISKIRQKFIDDKSPLVRSYAAAALGDLGDRESMSLLEKALKRERMVSVRLGMYSSLFRLGKKEVFWDIVSMLFTRSYRNRCSVINTLGGFIEDRSLKLKEEQVDCAKTQVLRLVKREKTRAVKTTIERFFRKCKQFKSYRCEKDN